MTDTMTETTVTVLTWSTAEASALFANAALFAGTDNTRPVLTCVQVNIEGAKVQFVSTDSYALGIIDATPADHPIGDGKCSHLIPAKSFADAAKAAKAAKAGTVELTIAGHTFTFAVHSMRGDTSTISGETLTHAEYPKWASLVPSANLGVDPQGFAFATNQLARLAKVQLVDPPKKSKYMPDAPLVAVKWVVCSPTKPSLVTIGDATTVVLMPTKVR